MKQVQPQPILFKAYLRDYIVKPDNRKFEDNRVKVLTILGRYFANGDEWRRRYDFPRYMSIEDAKKQLPEFISITEDMN